MYRLDKLTDRMTLGQLRRRAQRIDRRAGVVRSSTPPTPIVVDIPEADYNEGRIARKVQAFAQALSRIYGWRRTRARVAEMHEHLVAVAKAARFERCRYRRSADRGPCGGRIRKRAERVRTVDGIFTQRVFERFCDTCGRVPA